MYSNTPQKDHVLEIRKLLWTLLSDYTFGNIADSRILIHNFLVRQESFLSTPIRHIHVHLEEVALSENQHEKHKLADFRLPLSFRMTEAVVVAVVVAAAAAAAAADDDDDDDDDKNYLKTTICFSLCLHTVSSCSPGSLTALKINLKGHNIVHVMYS